MQQEETPGAGRVLVIEHDPALARLLRVTLEEEEIKADMVVAPEDILSAVREHRPQALVLDLLPYEQDIYAVLDALRSDPLTRGIPVVAMTTSGETASGALASYNVRASLEKPFEFDEFLTAVRSALRSPTLHAEIQRTSGPARMMALAERILAERSREVVFNWVQRVQQEPPWRERHDLDLQELLNSLPVVVQSLNARLHHESTADFFTGHPEIAEPLAEHSRLRRQQGIPVSAVVHEYTLLRDTLWRMFGDHLPAETALTDFLELRAAVDTTLDAIVERTIQTYLEGTGTE